MQNLHIWPIFVHIYWGTWPIFVHINWGTGLFLYMSIVSTAEMPFLPGIVKIIYSYTGESPRVDSASHCVIIAPYIHLKQHLFATV